jgi:predicted nucleic acid-binding protein
VNRILLDTGPLVALLDARDADHALCVSTARRLTGTLVTTWPVLTEACYLLGPDATAQDALLGKVESGDIGVAAIEAEDTSGIRTLLAKYGDLPMDLADATLVHVANRDRLDTVFTLDADFDVYRLQGGRPFKVHPAPARR